jgi:hypothetical protein
MVKDKFREDVYLAKRRGAFVKGQVVKKSDISKKGEDVDKIRGIRGYLIVGVCFVLFLILIYLMFPFSFFGSSQSLICGDGTFIGTCSLNKPYYCDSGLLIYNADVCGCPKILKKDNLTCYSELYEGEIEVPLRYVLRGNEGFVYFKMYEGIVDNLTGLSRTLIYSGNEVPRRDDFKLMKINDIIQREALIPLVVEIQNLAPDSVEDQARIAISIVQNINYGEPDFKEILGGRYKVRLSRYPYETLFGYTGSCEGKSELLSFLLREIGYSVALFYYGSENHEAVGIKCPIKYSLNGTGYCFVETTVPVPISYSTGKYLGIYGGKLYSRPNAVIISKGISLSDDMYEYKDAEKLDSIMSGKGINKNGAYVKLAEKYGF